ncbi:hypothetical protein L3Q82_025414 [Scortum barcoo]|uniref:Uncharacterized protein n=1 Tax=Scortum barcoo TaxID=214431 RepID=A0ACB8WLQ3_9TELE|nr:hypothetical protein L3Q82_025414 [Scortum barcoo]
MEEDYRSASKRFWQTVRRLRRGKQYSANTVYSAGGELLTSTEDIFSKLLGGKAPGVDEIRPEYLKSLDVVGLSWLTRLCNIAWRLGTVPLEWQTGVVVPLFKKGDRRVCSNYRGITLLSLPGKVSRQGTGEENRSADDSRTLGFRRNNAVFVLVVEQSGPALYYTSRAGCLEGLWEFAQPVHMCFVDLEKAFDRVPRVVFCGRFLRRSQGPEGVRFGNHRISSLLFADDVVLLASSSQDLQHVYLERFAAECEAAGMRISTSKSEAMVLDRKRVVCPLRVSGEVLPQVEEFKYLGVLFTSEGKMEREIDRRIGAASAVMRSVYRTVVVKKELSRKG